MEFGTINVYRMDTHNLKADLFTKNLPSVDFWRHVNSTSGLTSSELSMIASLEGYQQYEWRTQQHGILSHSSDTNGVAAAVFGEY